MHITFATVILKECAQSVFDALGSGHSEAIYHAAMEVELRIRGIKYSTKAPIPLAYKGCVVGWCIADLVIHASTEELIDKSGNDYVVELKATTYAPR